MSPGVAGLFGIGFGAAMMWLLSYHYHVIEQGNGWIGIGFAAGGQLLFTAIALAAVARRPREEWRP